MPLSPWGRGWGGVCVARPITNMKRPARLLFRPSAVSRHLSRDCDHPAETEAVGQHPEARRPERFDDRHPDAPADSQRVLADILEEIKCRQIASHKQRDIIQSDSEIDH